MMFFLPGWGGGGGNSSSTLVPMREQENAYKGVFFRDERVYANRGVKLTKNKKKGVFFHIMGEQRVKRVCFVNFGIAHLTNVLS